MADWRRGFITMRFDESVYTVYKYSLQRIELRAPVVPGGERTGMTTGSSDTPIRASIAGATGYAGQELVRLLARHPRAALTLATASQATSTPRRLPGLARIWDGEVRPLDVDALAGESDVVFLALPEATSAGLAPRLLERGLRVVDLSGAFRLRDEGARAQWYPATETMPEGVAYGLTEFELEAIRAARLLSNPGCYPTASLLALLPAPGRRRPSGPTSARTTARWRLTASSDTGTPRRWSRPSASP
jgi:hypothetical protein